MVCTPEVPGVRNAGGIHHCGRPVHRLTGRPTCCHQVFNACIAVYTRSAWGSKRRGYTLLWLAAGLKGTTFQAKSPIHN